MHEYIKIILDAAVIVALIISLIVFLRRGRKVKTLKAGAAGVELSMEGMDEQTAQTFKTLWGRFDELKESINESKVQYKEIALQNKKDLMEQTELINAIVKKVDGIFVDHLKMMFYSPTLDNEERMCAGLKYVHEGFNHTMKNDCVSFCIEYPVIYKSLTLAVPDWKIPQVEKAIAGGGFDLI